MKILKFTQAGGQPMGLNSDRIISVAPVIATPGGTAKTVISMQGHPDDSMVYVEEVFSDVMLAWSSATWFGYTDDD